jgi:hypothetical protein
MAILLHGTTRQRADRIMAHGPNPNFVESPSDWRHCVRPGRHFPGALRRWKNHEHDIISL